MTRRMLLIVLVAVLPSIGLAQVRPTLVLRFESDAELARVVTALSVRHGYEPTLADGTPNPQTRREFVRLYLAGVAMAETVDHERRTEAAAIYVAPVVID